MTFQNLNYLNDACIGTSTGSRFWVSARGAGRSFGIVLVVLCAAVCEYMISTPVFHWCADLLAPVSSKGCCCSVRFCFAPFWPLPDVFVETFLHSCIHILNSGLALLTRQVCYLPQWRHACRTRLLRCIHVM